MWLAVFELVLVHFAIDVSFDLMLVVAFNMAVLIHALVEVLKTTGSALRDGFHSGFLKFTRLGNGCQVVTHRRLALVWQLDLVLHAPERREV